MIAYLEGTELLDVRLVRLLVPVFGSLRKDASGAVRLSLALSVAQAQHARLTVTQCIFLVLTASLAGVMAYGTKIQDAHLISHVVLNSVPIMEPKVPSFEIAAILLDPLLSLMNIAGDCVGVAVVHSVMCQDLAVAPEGHLAPTTGQPGAATGEYDASCEPYFHRDAFLNQTPLRESDFSAPISQPTPEEPRELNALAQVPIGIDQEKLASNVGPTAPKEHEKLLALLELQTPTDQENVFPLCQPPTDNHEENLVPPTKPPTPREQAELSKKSNAQISENRCPAHKTHEQQINELDQIYY